MSPARWPGRKISDLKTAAANAVDSFLGSQDPKKPRVRVAIVPYADAVNTGAACRSSVYVESNASQRQQAPGDASAVARFGVAAPRQLRHRAQGGAIRFADAGPDCQHGQSRLSLSGFNRDYTHRCVPGRRSSCR